MLRVLRPWTQKVLKMDRLICRRARKFDGALGPEGSGIAIGNAYKVSVTRVAFLWHMAK